MRKKNGGDASAKGGENVQECRRECWTPPQNHKANGVDERSTDLGEGGGRREITGSLRSKKEKKRSTRWQCNEEVQNMEDKSWRNEELKKCEEALPRLKEGNLEKAPRLYRAKTGVGCDGLHPKVPLDLTTETRGKVVEFLEKVDQSDRWLQQACTTTFFLIPKNVTSESPMTLMETLIRWWEALRAPEVAKWQQKYRLEWDATNGRNRGAQRTVWEVFMEMDRNRERAEKIKEQLSWCWTWQRLSNEFVSLWCGLGATHFSFPKKILRVLCGYFEHQWRVQFEGCAAEPLTTITAILPGSKSSCVLLRIVLRMRHR